MICKYCGMESTTTDRCSLCGESLAPTLEEATAPQPEATAADRTVETTPPLSSTEQMSPPPAAKPGGTRSPAPAMMPRNAGPTLRIPAPFMPPTSTRADHPTFSFPGPASPAPPEQPAPRFTLTGEPIPAEVETSPGTASTLSQAGDEPIAIGLQTLPEAPGTAASLPDEVEPVLPRQSLPANLDGLVGSNVRATDQKADDAADDDKLAPLPPARTLVMRFAAIFVPILLLAGIITHFLPGEFWAPLLVAQFAGGLLLPLLRVVPWADEDSDDLIYFALLTLIFGPLISLVIYGVIGLIRQNANPALIGCMIVATLSWITVMAATGNTSLPANLSGTMPFVSTGGLNGALVAHLLLTWSGFVAIAGWFTAGIFHKLDE